MNGPEAISSGYLKGRSGPQTADKAGPRRSVQSSFLFFCSRRHSPGQPLNATKREVREPDVQASGFHLNPVDGQKLVPLVVMVPAD